MKYLIIHSSYRKVNTYRILSSFKSYMKTNGHVEFEEIFLSTLDIPFCMGCNRCFLKGENCCPHSLIIQPIVEKIINSDAFIIATPTYSLQVSGLLKCWIDHMSYNFHRPRFSDKKALVIVTTAGAGAKSTARYLKNVLEFWGVNHTSMLAIKCFSFDYIPQNKIEKKISRTANKFYKEVDSHKLRSPNLKQIFIFNLWRSMAISGKGKNTTDYLYWQTTDLLNKPYFPGVTLNPPKKLLAYISYKFSIKMIK